MSYDLKTLSASASHARKPRPFEIPRPHHLPFCEDIRVELMRRFVVLPAGNAVLLRYRPRTLAGTYCFVTVEFNERGCDVTFRNSSY
jgi:hypothetical protein